MFQESKGERRMNGVVGDGYGSTGLICLPASFQQIASRCISDGIVAIRCGLTSKPWTRIIQIRLGLDRNEAWAVLLHDAAR